MPMPPKHGPVVAFWFQILTNNKKKLLSTENANKNGIFEHWLIQYGNMFKNKYTLPFSIYFIKIRLVCSIN